MLRRFKWALAVCLIPILLLIPLNQALNTDITNAREGSNRNFITLVFIEALLIFGISFQIISQYFIVHPDYDSLILDHKKDHPEIPNEYYKDSNNNHKNDKNKGKE